MKPEKCSFEKKSVDYLGIIVGNGELQMDPKKVSTISDWPEPENKKQVQSFLGFCNFYCRFIRDFSKIAKPLTSLTGKVPWLWTKDHSEAFEELKKRLCTQPVLQIPIDDAPF